MTGYVHATCRPSHPDRLEMTGWLWHLMRLDV